MSLFGLWAGGWRFAESEGSQAHTMGRHAAASVSFSAINTFGELLKVLRRRARLTQRDLGAAVGYSESYITRLEGNSRLPDPGAILALFIDALKLQDEPQLARRLIELAEAARGAVALTVAPSAPSLGPPLHNLPAQLTRFIGREKETTEVQRLLATTRLLTLTGSGGAGKTRLALEVGASLVGAAYALALVRGFADGVWLAELAPITDPALAPDIVARAMGLHPTNRPALAVLTDYLRERELLIILDNCEHLIQACAELAEALLRACPRLRILATSREPLNITGEVTWRVPSLPADEAMQLFAERAQAARPDFTLSEQNIPIVAHICERLDGMPLAVELAAARVRAFSIQQIAARLDDRFHLLTGGSRVALPRQQTLRAAIDWSYNLLSDDERCLLRRLSVFAGGWTLQDAEWLCSGSESSEWLAQLVNKSLVVVEESRSGTRYRLLETIRQYAHERLEETGEGEPTRQGHLQVFTNLAQAAGLHLGGPAQVQWLDRLEPELDNLRAALAWVARRADTQAAERLIDGIWWFWFLRAHLAEGIRWIGDLLLADHVTDAATRVKANTWMGWLGIHKGNVSQSRGWLSAAAEQVRPLSDARLLLLVLCGQGLIVPDYAEAVRLLNEALEIAQRCGWQLEQARAMWALGTRMRRQGDPQHATQLLTQGLALAREVGDRYLCAQILLKLGLRALDRQDYVPARALLEESVTLARELGAEVGIADSLIELGVLGVRQCDFDLARPAIQECITAYGRAGNIQRLAQCMSMAAGIADALGRIGPAARLLAAAAAARADTPRRMEYNSTLYEEYDRLLPWVRAELDPDAFEAAWAEGQRLTLNQAIQEALAA